MRARTFIHLVVAIALLGDCLPILPTFAADQSFLTATYSEPIDAVSIGLPSTGATGHVSYLANGQWSDWQTLERDSDVGSPGEKESDLLMFPAPVSAVRVQGVASEGEVHPVTVSHDPAKMRVASLVAQGKSTILSRTEWGVDDTYLFDGKTETESASDTGKGDSLGSAVDDQTSARITDCQAAQQKYADEFKVERTVKKDASGKMYRWPLQYSPGVRLLVVHHTALSIGGDPRPAVERLRALYKYHAVSRGWGDIGYHYVIDENGQIYEGRQGGSRVVGGHAYCNNIGSIGIVLMGNFELEDPTQAQTKALQWLASDLGRQYGIDLKRSLQFHGKFFDSPIVGHRDLMSTLCPGTVLYGALGQIVRHVQTGNVDASVVFPVRTSSSASSARSAVIIGPTGIAEGISFVGRTAITINPGGQQRLNFSYTSGSAGAYQGKKIADVRLSSPAISLIVDDGIDKIPVSTGILLPYDLPAGDTLSVQLIVQAPVDPGAYWMEIGGLRFSISVAGRRARTGIFFSPFYVNPALLVRPILPARETSISARIRAERRQSSSSSGAARTVTRPTAALIPQPVVPTVAAATATIHPIRIRLNASVSPTVTFTDPGTIGGQPVRPGTTVSLVMKSGQCEAQVAGQWLAASPVLQLTPGVSGTLVVESVRGAKRSYRGSIECRIDAGSLILINELPLDVYLQGLSEEPDTELYEKQRAFAIAARTYAAYYLDPSHRKFPGKPYDGSDDPALFQSYSGVNFEAANPNWLRAVASTAGQVLTSGGQLIRPPYFSSDDGRTKGPREAGWNNFPFEEIFSSKPDPWCKGLPNAGHGVGMSGCGAKGQAQEGRSAEQILRYYYPGVRIGEW